MPRTRSEGIAPGTMKLFFITGTALCKLELSENDDLADLIRTVKAQYGRRVGHYLGESNEDDVTFYRLEPPPPVKAFARMADKYTITNFEAVIKDVEKIELDPVDTLADSFGIDFDPRSVPLYIEKLPDTPAAIERQLTAKFAKLFPCLVVHNSGTWRREDVENNNASFADMEEVPQDVLDLISRLSTPRQYKNEPGDGAELREACKKALKTSFSRFFTANDGATAQAANLPVDFPIEYTVFQNVAAFIWAVGISGIDAERRVSELKAAMVTNTFVNYPGFSHFAKKAARLSVGTAWPFNMFVKSAGNLYSYQPKSDFSFLTYDEKELMPILIGEVISDDQESDRWRMLCQAIALVRLGNQLLKAGAATTFVIMAVYVNNEFRADRYLLYMTEDSETHVNIICHQFDLKDADAGRTFLLGMYNFGDEITCVAKDIDRKAYTQLKTLIAAGAKLPSWSSRRANATPQTSRSKRVSATTRLTTVPEGRTESIQAAVDSSEDVRSAMHQLGLTDDLFMVLGNPFVALVNSRVETGRQYYLKFLRPGRTVEVEILSYLATIVSPDNHAVRPVASHACDLGTLLLLPNAGIPVRDYEDGHAYLVPIASQFLRAVAFLHENKVAHCDLKTSNVVVDRSTGRLTLIDFDLAVRGLDWLDGFSGTDGWTAPEVGVIARYNPMQADVWSAGKVLHTTAWNCFGSPYRQFLLDLSDRMMAVDPNARPSMKNIVEMFERYVESHGRSEYPTAGASNFELHFMDPASQTMVAV